MSVRHCNAYHTKDGMWRFIREKYKERREREQNLLKLKRDLHSERKNKRKEKTEKVEKLPEPINLADLELKMAQLEEIRLKKVTKKLI